MPPPVDTEAEPNTTVNVIKQESNYSIICRGNATDLCQLQPVVNDGFDAANSSAINMVVGDQVGLTTSASGKEKLLNYE